VTDKVRIIDAHDLYAAMNAHPTLTSSELNIEGAIADGDSILFLQRCNGEPKPNRTPLSASARVRIAELCAFIDGKGKAPELYDVKTWDLGAINGSRLSFTDGVMMNGKTIYVAAAEASADAGSDGPVAGVVIGALGEGHSPLLDDKGHPVLDKIEGLAIDRRSPNTLLGVIDKDDPHAPCDLVTIQLR
jgi:Family of unknown function (DUF6910)